MINKTAIFKGQEVTLVEHFNRGAGWLCRTSDGRIIPAKYSELFNVDGSSIYTAEQIEKANKRLNSEPEPEL